MRRVDYTLIYVLYIVFFYIFSHLSSLYCQAAHSDFINIPYSWLLSHVKESLSSSLRDLKSSVSDLTSSVTSLSSQLSVTSE